MKKRYSLVLLALLSFSSLAFALQPQEAAIHLAKLVQPFSTITVEYVSCMSISASDECINPIKHSIVMEQSSDKIIQLEGTDTFITALKTQDGKYIWGPHAPVLNVNACSTSHGSNSFLFKSNSNDSVTCLRGMD